MIHRTINSKTGLEIHNWRGIQEVPQPKEEEKDKGREGDDDDAGGEGEGPPKFLTFYRAVFKKGYFVRNKSFMEAPLPNSFLTKPDIGQKKKRWCSIE